MTPTSANHNVNFNSKKKQEQRHNHKQNSIKYNNCNSNKTRTPTTRNHVQNYSSKTSTTDTRAAMGTEANNAAVRATQTDHYLLLSAVTTTTTAILHTLPQEAGDTRRNALRSTSPSEKLRNPSGLDALQIGAQSTTNSPPPHSFSTGMGARRGDPRNKLRKQSPLPIPPVPSAHWGTLFARRRKNSPVYHGKDQERVIGSCHA